MPERIAANKRGDRRLERRRKARHANVDWRFTTADARIKLERLYFRSE